MLSLKVSNQASLQPTHAVYSDWDLGSSLDGGFVEAVRALEIDGSKLNAHNNTVSFTSHSAQMAAYSPVEDKVYTNEEESLFAIFDGHGGGIKNIRFLFFLHKGIIPQH
jgi:hypothetical protein